MNLRVEKTEVSQYDFLQVTLRIPNEYSSANQTLGRSVQLQSR